MKSEKQRPQKAIKKEIVLSESTVAVDISNLRVSTRKGKPGRKRVIRENPMRVGKDEMNLIEHPFAVLWQKEAGDAVMYYEWDARHPKTGKVLPASWMVAGHREHGLPTSTDERVYLVLLELTREAGFKSPTIHFSRYDICKRLGWHINSNAYTMLQAAFDRLIGATLTGKNAFWSPKSQSFLNTAFHIIESYSINAEAPGRKSQSQTELPLSWFKWSDVMFDSFQSGYIRTLDLDFALGLKSDIALRLYRYLDKKSYDSRESFEIELFNLGNHLGMKPTLYPSKLKERLQKAHDELIAKGFLQTVHYDTMKESSQKHRNIKVCYAFAPRRISAGDESGTQFGNDAPNGTLEKLGNSVEERMTRLGVSPETVSEFLQNVDEATLQLQLDCLTDREPQDAAATFVKAVREAWATPQKYTKRVNAEKSEEERRMNQEAKKQKKAQEEAAKRQEMALSETEAAQLDEIWDDLDQQTQDRIETEVRDRLGIFDTGGKNSPRFAAMRRVVLREWTNKASAEK
jgi:hypothetical protein